MFLNKLDVQIEKLKLMWDINNSFFEWSTYRPQCWVFVVSVKTLQVMQVVKGGVYILTF